MTAVTLISDCRHPMPWHIIAQVCLPGRLTGVQIATRWALIWAWALGHTV
jgi:hypothetical protein